MSNCEIAGLCPSLKHLLAHELECENKILAVETGWSKVKLAVRLAAPLDVAFVRKAVKGNSDLEIWQSRDVKNPREMGVLCKSARQSLSGPLLESLDVKKSNDRC